MGGRAVVVRVYEQNLWRQRHLVSRTPFKDWGAAMAWLASAGWDRSLVYEIEQYDGDPGNDWTDQ